MTVVFLSSSSGGALIRKLGRALRTRSKAESKIDLGRRGRRWACGGILASSNMAASTRSAPVTFIKLIMDVTFFLFLIYSVNTPGRSEGVPYLHVVEEARDVPS